MELKLSKILAIFLNNMMNNKLLKWDFKIL